MHVRQTVKQKRHLFQNFEKFQKLYETHVLNSVYAVCIAKKSWEDKKLQNNLYGFYETRNYKNLAFSPAKPAKLRHSVNKKFEYRSFKLAKKLLFY